MHREDILIGGAHRDAIVKPTEDGAVGGAVRSVHGEQECTAGIGQSLPRTRSGDVDDCGRIVVDHQGVDGLPCDAGQICVEVLTCIVRGSCTRNGGVLRGKVERAEPSAGNVGGEGVAHVGVSHAGIRHILRNRPRNNAQTRRTHGTPATDHGADKGRLIRGVTNTQQGAPTAGIPEVRATYVKGGIVLPQDIVGNELRAAAGPSVGCIKARVAGSGPDGDHPDRFVLGGVLVAANGQAAGPGFTRVGSISGV